MSKIVIRALHEDEFKIWDTIVERSPQGTIFHTLDWLKINAKHTDSQLFLIVGYLGNEPVGAIPIFYRRKNFFKVVSSPLGSTQIPHLGPIFPDYDVHKQNKREFYFSEFQKEFDEFLVQKLKPDRISISTSPNLLDVRPFIWNDYQVIPKYNYCKDITNLDILWNGFKKELRKNIEKAEHEGFVIEQAGLEEIQFISQSISRRFDEQEMEYPASNEYLLDIFNAYYPEHLKIFIAKMNGEPITGIVVTGFRDTLSIWIGATQTTCKGLYPVDLLQWKIIEWGNKNGYKKCEILGANLPSISYFKSRYNFDLEIYFSVNKTQRTYRIVNSLFSYFST
jgi:hypothetical protein